MVYGAFRGRGRCLRLLHLDAVEGLKGCDVIVLLAVGRELAGSDRGDVEELLDHAAKGELHLLGGSGAAVPGAYLLHLGVQDVHGVAAQRDNGCVHGTGFAFGLEGGGSACDDCAGLGQRLRLLPWSGEPNRLKGQQFDAFQFTNCGIKIVGEGKVDGNQRLARVGTDTFKVRGFDPVVRATAADHDVGGGHSSGERVGVERVAAAGSDESFGAAGRSSVMFNYFREEPS